MASINEISFEKIRQIMENCGKALSASDFHIFLNWLKEELDGSSKEFGELVERVEVLEGIVGPEDNTVPPLVGEVKALIGAVDNINITKIPGLNNRVTTIEGQVNGAQGTTGLITEVNTLKTQVNGGSGTTGLISQVNTLNTIVGDNIEGLDKLTTEVSGLKTRVNNTEGDITSIEGDITSLDGRVSIVETTTGNLNDDILAVDGRVTNLEATVNGVTNTPGLTERVTDLETTVVDLTSGIKALETTVDGDVTTEVTGLTSIVSTHTGEINSLGSNIAAIYTEIDGTEEPGSTSGIKFEIQSIKDDLVANYVQDVDEDDILYGRINKRWEEIDITPPVNIYDFSLNGITQDSQVELEWDDLTPNSLGLLVSTLNAAPAPYTVDNQADTIITLSNDDEVYSITALSTNETNDYKTGEIEFIQTTSDLRVKVTIIQKNKPMLQGFSPGFSSGFSS